MKINEDSRYCVICRAIYRNVDKCPIHKIRLRMRPRRKTRPIKPLGLP